MLLGLKFLHESYDNHSLFSGGLKIHCSYVFHKFYFFQKNSNQRNCVLAMEILQLKDIKTVPDPIHPYPKIAREENHPIVIDNGKF
jgi:hypothetical protein